MTRNKISLKPIALTLCLLAANICGQTPKVSQSPTTDVIRLERELEPKINEAISKGQLPGFAIGVVKNGKLIYAKGFGVAKLGTEIPVTSRSLFHMASVTKTFVATAVMQLVEQGAERELLALQAPRNNQPRVFYFDPQTGLLLRVEERNAANEVTSATEYDDYREVDGVKVPFVIHHIDDAHFLIKLAEVKQNVAIDDEVFVKPKK